MQKVPPDQLIDVEMFEILSAHQELIAKFGGHHMAAGMTMDIGKYRIVS